MKFKVYKQSRPDLPLSDDIKTIEDLEKWQMEQCEEDFDELDNPDNPPPFPLLVDFRNHTIMLCDLSSEFYY